MNALIADISNLQLLGLAGVVVVASTVMFNWFLSRLNSDSEDDSEGALSDGKDEGLAQAAVSSRVGTPRAKRIQPAQGGDAEGTALNPLPAGNSGMLVPGGFATAGAEAFAKPTEPPKETKPGASIGTELTSKADIAAALAGLAPASTAATETKKESATSVNPTPSASLVALPPLAVGGPAAAPAVAGSLPPLGSLTAPAKEASITVPPLAPGLVPAALNPPVSVPADKSAVSTPPGAERGGESLTTLDKPEPTEPAGSNPPVDLTDVKKKSTPPPPDQPPASTSGLILIPPSESSVQPAAPAGAAKPLESTVMPAKSESEPEPKPTGRPRIFMPANQPAGSAKPAAEKTPEPVAPVAAATPAAVEAVPETPATLAGASPAESKTPAAPANKTEPAPVQPAAESTAPKADVPLPEAAPATKPTMETPPILPTASLVASTKSAPVEIPLAPKPEPMAPKPEPTPAKADLVAKPEPVPAKVEPVAVKPEPISAKPEPVAKPETSATKPEPVAAKPEPKKIEQPPPLPTMLTTLPAAPASKSDVPPEDGTPGAPLVPAAIAPAVKPTASLTESPSKSVTAAVVAPTTTPAISTPAVSVTTPQPKMALTESTTSVPANARAAAQLTLGFEITSLQLTPFFKLGAVQLRPLSNIVSLHLIASQAADNPLAAGISFQIVTVELNEAQHLRSILLKPLPQSQPAAVPQPKLQVDTVQITRAGENAPIEIRSSDQTSTAVQLIADFTIAAMDFTPSFEIGSLRLEPTSNSVLLRLAASQKPTALDLPPSFEVANVQLAGDAQFAGVRLTPGTAPKPA